MDPAALDDVPPITFAGWSDDRRNVGRGRWPLRLKVPKRARKGSHRLVVKVAAGSASKTFERNVTLER